MLKIGILCAMDEEIKTLKQSLTSSTITNVSDIKFYEGTINDQSVVLVCSGIGKVQAGLTTALLIVKFKVDIVINSGSASGVGSGLHVGDTILASQTAYHDVDVRAFNYEYGQLPGMPARFNADKNWIVKLKKIAEYNGLLVKCGLIVSGDQFIASKANISKIFDHFPDAIACEMEGAAVGQVAHQFGVPYMVVRAISDVGDENAGISFDDFVIEAGKRSANMLLALCKSI